jgi:hypothetical protein
MALRSQQWAYLAGLIDGEGCIAAHKPNLMKGKCYAKLTMVNTDKRMLEWCVETTGIGRVTIHARHLKNPKWKTVYKWWVGADNLRYILEGVMPYLTTKKEQAQLALDLIGPPRPPLDRQGELCELLKLEKKRDR